MPLGKRVSRLEARIAPHIARWVRIFQYEGQSQEQAIAAHEAAHDPLEDSNVILRVFINKPFPVPAYRH